MMKNKKTTSAMKNHKTAKTRLRGARPVCFDGKFIGYTEKTCRDLRAVAKQAKHLSIE
jgi:fumarate hydratase class II